MGTALLALRKLLSYTGDPSNATREFMAGCLIGIVRQELVPIEDQAGYRRTCDSLHMTDNVGNAVEMGDWGILDKMANTPAMASPDFVPMRPKQ